MATEDGCFGKDYLDKFEPTRYLEMCVFDNKRIHHQLRCFYDAFQKLPNNLKILDYGSGPSLMPAITAVTKASEIILSDYSPRNREMLRQWLREENASSFDWNPHFKFVVQQLEGDTREEAVQERQKRVREAVKATVHCDLTQDPPIERGYDQSYDVVVSSLVVDTVPRTYEEFVDIITRLGQLVRQGGSLFLYCSENASFYMVGNCKFQLFPLTLNTVERALAAAGFQDIKNSDKFLAVDPVEQVEFTYFFIEGTRSCF